MVKKIMKKKLVTKEDTTITDEMVHGMKEYFLMGVSFLVIAAAAYYVMNLY